MPKKPRARTERRQDERTLAKLRDARQRLFTLEPGGSAERPLLVPSAAVVESQAESVPCPRCGGRHQVEEHVASTVGGMRLREARLVCRQCGSRRSLWFQIVPTPGLN